MSQIKQTFSLAGGELNFKLPPKQHETQKQTENAWTQQEIEKLTELYPTTKIKKIAQILNRTPQAIANRAFKLNLKKEKPDLKCQKPKIKEPGTKIGSITIRTQGYRETEKPYYHIKITKNHWEYLHRHIYEQLYGPIPQHKVVRFIDGNTLNCDINNLAYVTRAQNAQLNRQCKTRKLN